MSRLIDADLLRAEFNGNTLWHYTGIRAKIDSAPTVYNVDKIIKVLDDKARNCQNNAKYYGEKAEWMAQAYRDAIEIVKKGDAILWER